MKALSLFATIKQISLVIGYFSDFVHQNNPGKLRGLYGGVGLPRWITRALRDHTPMNPLIYMFRVEIVAVHQISMVDRNGR